MSLVIFLHFLIVEEVKKDWYEIFLQSLIDFSSDRGCFWWQLDYIADNKSI